VKRDLFELPRYLQHKIIRSNLEGDCESRLPTTLEAVCVNGKCGFLLNLA